MPNVVGERFQITIDKSVRERLGIKPGDQAIEWVEDGRMIVGFLAPPSSASMLGIVKDLTGKAVEPVTDWDAYFDQVWEARGTELQQVLDEDSRRHASKPKRRTRR
jgi:AbrB family looped-hinge helix DNA binding protein